MTILVGNDFVNVAIAAVSTSFLARSLPATEAAVVSTFLVGIVVLVFGEFVPKSYGVANAESRARRIADPVVLIQRLLYPVVAVFDSVTGAMSVLLGGAREIERPYVTREELEAVVETAERLGVIEDGEQAIIERVFGFSGTTVADVMVPRSEVVAVDADGTAGAALERCLDARVTRAPAYRGTLDTVVGHVDVRDLARADPSAPLEDLLLPVIHAFESKRIDETLASMQDDRVELAVVFDQFGTVEGLLTVEDIVEELVGEIFDVGERHRVVPLPDGRASGSSSTARSSPWRSSRTTASGGSSWSGAGTASTRIPAGRAAGMATTGTAPPRIREGRASRRLRREFDEACAAPGDGGDVRDEAHRGDVLRWSVGTVRRRGAVERRRSVVLDGARRVSAWV
ncbi:hypothetical protein BRC93_09635 [Halobacteriales archaeon QS_5_70_15]|nr:MAG: hypothetical protein BRC93_09635 [Halobacteriales archaeon QS_5_70_15]